MGHQKILSIGFQLASSDVQYCAFTSDTSLLDWDIILFRPDIARYLAGAGNYQGKPSLSESESFRLKERCEHWRREIKEAVDGGKTVVVFLSDLQEVFIDTGERQHSGTGRNQKVTRLVSPFKNYYCIQQKLEPVVTKGSAIKLSPRDSELVSSYWKEFESVSQYKVVLSATNIPACLLTKNGDKPVGALYRSNNSNGALLLAPDIDFEPKEFSKWKGETEVWTAAANRFALRMVTAVVALHKALSNAGEVTPEPSWAATAGYALVEESRLAQDLLRAEEKLERSRKAKEAIVEKLRSCQRFRGLLFEKGKPLERVIIDGLKVLGFTAASFKNSNSEFDVVFECAEGRLLGEAEGKDNKPVNVDKLRQLAMNINEDLMREEVNMPAKGVLFGNGNRLVSPQERGSQFTDKCITAATAQSIALVATSDLFLSVRNLLNSPSDEYARACREALLTGTGPVNLPSAIEDAPVSEAIAEVDCDA